VVAPVLGIDLGTTNSVVAHASRGEVQVLSTPTGDRLIPSVVSFHPNGEVLVGKPARERRLLDARNTIYSVKRLIGRPFDSEEVRRARERFAFDLQESQTGGVLVAARGESYTLSEISAFVLREVRAIAEQALGVACSKAVITVPANFNELQRSATKAAGRVAGLEVLRILNEPTAAALAYGYGRGSHERVAIFDLGGGTFDVTILELAGEVFEVLATAGDTYLGGDDIDSLIATQMAEAFLAHHRYDPRADRHAYERLRAAAEWAKVQLSHESEVQLRVEELAYGADGVSLDLTFGLTRPALEAMAMPLLARAFDVCEEAMRVAGVRPTQLDNVILVGGSTRMPLVHKMVEEYFGRPPLANIDPDLVVAEGAAIQAQALATSRAKSRLGKVTLKRVSSAGVRPPAIREENVAAGTDPRSAGAHKRPPPTPGKPPPPPPPLAMPKPGAGSHGMPPSQQEINPEPSVITAGIAMVGDPNAIPILDDEVVAFDGPAPGPPSAPPPLPGQQPPQPPGFEQPPPPGFEQPPQPGQHPGYPPQQQQYEEPAYEEVEAVAPPLLLDVTPLSLGVETVAGYCEHIIKRNSAIPTEQTRIFSTARDDQGEVVVKICQGESRRLDENQLLGEVALEQLLPGKRGAVQIEVTFMIDADGTLSVRAVDKNSGREQSIRIQLIGGVEDEQIDAMQARIEQMYAQQGAAPPPGQ